jgi:HSP20 family protein
MIQELKRRRKKRDPASLALDGKDQYALGSAINRNETHSEYVIYVAVPGMQRQDFSISVEAQTITVSAAKQEALHCPETEIPVCPSWNETFRLPEDADTLMTAAVYRNGELEIHIPKCSGEAFAHPGKIYVY